MSRELVDTHGYIIQSLTYFKSKQTRNVGHAWKSGREKEAEPEGVEERNASISLVHLDDGRVRQHFDRQIKDCVNERNLSHCPVIYYNCMYLVIK